MSRLLSAHPLAAPLASVVLWAVYLVASRLLMADGRYDPWAYVLIQLFAGGLFMLAVAGRARIEWRHALGPATQFYGATRVFTTGATSASLTHLPVAQSSLMALVNVPLAAAILWLAGRGRPAAREAGPILLLCAGLVALVASVPGGPANPGLLWQTASEASMILGALVAERHPSNLTDDIRERARFTGVVLVVTSAMAAAAWSAAGAAGFVASPFAAGGGAFGDPMLWLWAVLAGALLRGPGTWLTLYCLKASGTSTYVAMLTMLPFVSLGFEQIAALAGAMPGPALGPLGWTAAATILAGSLWLLAAKRHAFRA